MTRGRMTRRQFWTGIAALVAATVVFIIPFIFILLMAAKTKQEASRLSFSLPADWQLWQNLVDVIQARNYMLLLAYFNSTVITVGAVTGLVIFAARVGYVLQRRESKWNKVIYGFVLAGLMIPPAVVPTIWVLQGLGLFKTLHGMILIQIAYGLAFSILLYRSFIASIPRDLDEAAIIDGARPWQVFYKVVLPAATPSIFTGLRLGLGLAWFVIVVGEMTGVPEGLGAVIMDGRNLYEPRMMAELGFDYTGIGRSARAQALEPEEGR